MLDSYYRAFIAEQRYLMYLDGLKMTLLVSLLAIILGVALGTILALMRMTAERRGKSTLLSKIAYVYIDIIRGTPTVTQLLIMYFVEMCIRDRCTDRRISIRVYYKSEDRPEGRPDHRWNRRIHNTWIYRRSKRI